VLVFESEEFSGSFVEDIIKDFGHFCVIDQLISSYGETDTFLHALDIRLLVADWPVCTEQNSFECGFIAIKDAHEVHEIIGEVFFITACELFIG